MRAAILGCVAAGVLALGCPGSSGPRRTLRLELERLPVLGGDFHYQAWVMLGTTLRSAAAFRVEAGGRLVDLSGAEVAGGRFSTSFDLAGASAFVLSIEGGTAGDSPSPTRLLSGTFRQGAATLTTLEGTDLAGAAGMYVLATPTNGAQTDETSGLWFLAFYNLGDPPSPGLNLPALPAGWTFEGWAVIDGISVSTGRFSDPDGADDTASHAGPEPGPPFPGEDLLRDPPAGLSFPRDLSGATAMVSIEPVPDDDPAPFALTLLSATIPTPAQDHHVYTLANGTPGFPSGRAVLAP